MDNQGTRMTRRIRPTAGSRNVGATSQSASEASETKSSFTDTIFPSKKTILRGAQAAALMASLYFAHKHQKDIALAASEISQNLAPLATYASSWIKPVVAQGCTERSSSVCIWIPVVRRILINYAPLDYVF